MEILKELIRSKISMFDTPLSKNPSPNINSPLLFKIYQILDDNQYQYNILFESGLTWIPREKDEKKKCPGFRINVTLYLDIYSQIQVYG